VVPVDDAHALTLRLEPDLYERLRLLAFERRVSLASIIREGTEARVAELEAEAAARAG
jgi:predicted DNA-binding protein